MEAKKVSGSKLKQALEKFGALEKANEKLSSENQALKKLNTQLVQENAELTATRGKMITETKALDDKINHQKDELQACTKRTEQYDRQHLLVESLIAMVAGSPSVTKSINDLIASFQALLNPGWLTSKKADDLRSLFVRSVMGDYLKCFRCNICGARFIVNKEPYYSSSANYYDCPACHYPPGVKPDDSFLIAMVSEEQLENTRRIETVQKENDSLKPFKVFFNQPCEVCGKPCTEWTERDVKRGIDGLGWGHSLCWNTDIGQLKQLAKIVKERMGS